MMIQCKAHNSVARRMFLTSCGALLLFWPAGRATAQAPVGPLPAHPPIYSPTQRTTQDPVQAGTQTAKPKLAGTWKLDKDQSDDPHRAMQQAVGNSRRMGGTGGGRGGWGMGGGGGRSHGGYGQRSGNEERGMMNDFNQLEIDQTDSSVKVTGTTGRVLAQYSGNDQGNSKSASETSASAPTAEWQGSQLVVTTQNERGAKTTRTYELSSDGKQLYLTTRIDNPRLNQPVTFRFVYDPVKNSGDGSQ